MRASFRPHDTAPAMARRVLDGLSGRVPVDVLDDARLLLTELMTSAVLHAGGGEEETISVAVEAASAELFVEVSMRVPASGSGGPGVAPFPGTGWGLIILDRLADAWGVREHAGTTTSAWFRLRWEAGGAGPSGRVHPSLRPADEDIQ
jgi:hypothetical protein